MKYTRSESGIFHEFMFMTENQENVFFDKSVYIRTINKYIRYIEIL